MVEVSQDEGLSVLGQGQCGWPECEEFQVFWERGERLRASGTQDASRTAKAAQEASRKLTAAL